MSVHPLPIPPVPPETARIARAAFPKGNPYLTLRDQLGAIYQDRDFQSLFPIHGTPASAPWRLALITVLQFAENLSDRQAADAVRSRIDWKYLLSLPLTDAGLDHTALSDFRARLVEHGAEALLLSLLLTQAKQLKVARAGGRQRTDATHVLAAVRRLNRVELVGETLRATLEVLAVSAPDWLLMVAEEDWAERYGPRLEEYRLPKGEEARTALLETMGADGARLLAALDEDASPAWLRDLPAVMLLRRVWEQQFEMREERLSVRPIERFPPGEDLIVSPYDADARWGKKRTLRWPGYAVHVTESCDPELPHLITAVVTTPAPAADSRILPQIQADLVARDLRPAQQVVDQNYVTAQTLLESQKRGIDLLGRVAGDTSRQAREGKGFAAADFVVNWEDKQATCPQGNTSSGWVTRQTDPAQVRVRFSRTTCAGCPVHADCTTQPFRVLRLLPADQDAARRAAVTRQGTTAFQEAYQVRAGIEGTISQGVRRMGMRRARYRGLPKTTLEHALEAAAINLTRLAAYFRGDERSHTRRSHFTSLMAVAA